MDQVLVGQNIATAASRLLQPTFVQFLIVFDGPDKCCHLYAVLFTDSVSE